MGRFLLLYILSDSPPTASVSNNLYNGSIQPTETQADDQSENGTFIAAR